MALCPTAHPHIFAGWTNTRLGHYLVQHNHHPGPPCSPHPPSRPCRRGQGVSRCQPRRPLGPDHFHRPLRRAARQAADAGRDHAGVGERPLHGLLGHVDGHHRPRRRRDGHDLRHRRRRPHAVARARQPEAHAVDNRAAGAIYRHVPRTRRRTLPRRSAPRTEARHRPVPVVEAEARRGGGARILSSRPRERARRTPAAAEGSHNARRSRSTTAAIR